MKKLFLLCAITAVDITLGFATVRTVSNHPAGGSQYTTLQSAYNASVAGDTLLMEGTDIPYLMNGCDPWSKSLTVIGIGFNPDKQIPKRTKISYMDCHGFFLLSGNGSGSSFYGIEFTANIVVNNTPSLTNTVFENCKFNSNFNFQCNTTTNFAFRNCIFDADNSTNLHFGQCNASATGIISNCIFDGYIDGSNSVLAAVVIEHCIFLNTSGVQSFNNVRYADIRNNIFVNRFPAGTFNSNYQNNLCAVAGTFPPAPANGNTASGNIENTNPFFATYTSGSLYSNLHNYDVQPASAANNAASDGTDIGVHGGYTLFDETGETLINPIIRAMNILNTSVSPNGTLNVQVIATKPSGD